MTKCNRRVGYIWRVPDLDLEALLAELRELDGDSAAQVKSALGGLPSTTGETLCALANHPGGGVLLLGLDEPAGCESSGRPAGRARYCMCEP